MDITKSRSLEPDHPTTFKSSSPSPRQFEVFLPWACRQFEVQITIECNIINLKDTDSRKATSVKSSHSGIRALPSVVRPPIIEKILPETTDRQKSSSSIRFTKGVIEDKEVIQIKLTYDYARNLVGIKFTSTNDIPRTVFKIIALTVEFHPYLTTLTVNRGVDEYSIYEITQFLSKSSICELYMDGTCLKKPNYYMLLEPASSLSCLSLSKCQITDETVQFIADCLVFSRPAAKTLIFLNLSSNRITDVGASYLAHALRSNRKLAYLNLAGNLITDTGAFDIFNTLLEFHVTYEEYIQSKLRRKNHSNEIKSLAVKIAAELKEADEKKIGKKKGVGLATKVIISEFKNLPSTDKMYNEKAEIMASKEILGEFPDPLRKTILKNDIRYCNGNNTLTCLNLAYNNLSYCSVKKLLEVLRYQESNCQKPRGLFRVRLEGNNMPQPCKEYAEIDILLESSMDSQKFHFSKKK